MSTIPIKQRVSGLRVGLNVFENQFGTLLRPGLQQQMRRIYIDPFNIRQVFLHHLRVTLRYDPIPCRVQVENRCFDFWQQR